MTMTSSDVSGEQAPDDLMALYLRQWAQFRSLLKKNVGSHELAEDAMQETWLRLSRMEMPPDGIKDRQAYILRLAVNIAIDMVRKERRHASRCVSDDALLQTIADTYPSPETFAVDRDQLRQLAAALMMLPAKSSTALLMSRCDGLTYAEIAARLKVSERAVAKYLVTALRHCRDHFRRLG
ncbi:MAG: RNA polymerase sigma factor [Hyphomicrobiaceae bacterium]